MPVPRFPIPAVACAIALASAAAARAESNGADDALRRQVEDLQRRMQEMEERHRREMDDLRRTATPAPSGPSALQEQIDRLVDEVDTVKARLPAQSASRPAFRLVDVSLNALMSAGWSTDDDDTIQALQAGGHDPNRRGFTLQNVELVLSGAVDPWFTAQTNLIALIDTEGETVVELEEAWVQTSSLPAGFQARAGQFYAPFGRHNTTHPHQWDFADIPVVSGRFLGPDGMRGQGAQLSWLGTGVPLELTAALQNANGETMTSFLGTEEEEPPAGAYVERTVRSPDDLVATGRLAVSFDATDEIPLLFGGSYAHGPSGASDDGDTSLTGFDVTAKWRPLDAEAGFPFVSLRAEWISRDYAFDDAAGRSTLDDSGWYAQATWGFARDWAVGLRHDRFSGDFDDVAGLDDRTRWTAALTWWSSEFAKLRLQVNHDDARSLDDRVTSVWLQIEFNLGAHGAHRF